MLRTFLQNNSLGKVVEFWDNGNEYQMFRRWKERSWWQEKALEEDIEDFLMGLYEKRITKNEDPDKLRWGYANSGNFNPKEALGLLIRTHNLVPEARPGKKFGLVVGGPESLSYVGWLLNDTS